MCSNGQGVWSALKLGCNGIPYSKKGGGSQGLVGLAIDLSHCWPFFWDCVEENKSLLCITESHAVHPKVLKKHVHPLHIGVRIMGGRQFHWVCCIHICSYLRNTRSTKPGPKVSPSVSTCHTDVWVEHLRDARANNALHLLGVLVPCSLELCFSWGGSPSSHLHRPRASRSTGSNAPEALGLEVVPHILFPDSEIWACEDRNGGGEVVVVGGGHFNGKFLWRNLSSAHCWQWWSQKKRTPLCRRGSMPMCGALDCDKGCCHYKGRGYCYKWWASHCLSCAN